MVERKSPGGNRTSSGASGGGNDRRPGGGGGRDRRPPQAPATPAFRGLKSLRAPVGSRNVTDVLVSNKEPRIDKLGRSYATGRRKDAVARVWIKPGKGKFIVNGRDGQAYFARPVLWMLLNQPFQTAQRDGQFDVMCTVEGGGLSGQAGAVRHGISRALTYFEPGLRPALKTGGFLTRDSRIVERKKYGRAKARRSFQFSKR